MMTTVALRRGAAAATFSAVARTFNTAASVLGVAALALLVSLALLAAAGALIVRALCHLITGGPTTRSYAPRLLPFLSANGRASWT
jgi:hypothetical protein